MISYGEEFGFGMKMFGGSHLVAPSDYSHANFLNSLKPLNLAGGNVRIPNWACKVSNGWIKAL